MKLHPMIAHLVWAGLEETMLEASEALYRLRSAEASPKFVENFGISAESEWAGGRHRLRGEHLLTRDKNTALIHISGPLLNIDSLYAGHYGITTYADIKRAAGIVAEAEGVDRVGLMISSGGGAADGAEDAYSTLLRLGEIKPIFTHAVGTMASAALMLGFAGKRMTASSMSLVGSIGTIMPSVSQVGAMEKEGYAVEVFRSGKYKAPGHPMEKLTDKHRELIQERLDDMSEVFHEIAAKRYGVTAKQAWATFGDGRTFVGQKAVDAGLVSAITTAETLRPLDNSQMTELNGGSQEVNTMSTPRFPG